MVGIPVAGTITEPPLAPVADGTCLIARVTDGPRPCTFVLDLKRIPELNRLDYDERVGLRIGAAVVCPSILDFPPVRHLYPILADACSPIHPKDAGEHSTFG